MGLDLLACMTTNVDESHLQCPTKVAAAVANAPHHKHCTPFSLILSRSSFSPARPPRVCCVVFSVSIGVKVMRKVAEASEAASVLINTGQVNDSSSASIPALAAVSPNLAKGPWNLAISNNVFLKTHKAAPNPA